MRIWRMAPSIVAGGAFGTIGLSFGRNFYKSMKKNRSKDSQTFVLAIAIFVLSAFGLFISGLWISRNYRTIVQNVFMVLFGVILIVISLIVMRAYFEFLTPSDLTLSYDLPSFMVFAEEFLANSQALLFSMEAKDWRGIDQSTLDVQQKATVFYFWLTAMVLFGLGSLLGYSQRSKRKNAWLAEECNLNFLAQIGLKELTDGQFQDSEGNRYRVEHTFADRIELFPMGRRNRRAYLTFDETGKFTEWTGIIKI